jgi:hypothetical protein
LTTLNRTFAFDWQALATPTVSFHAMKKILIALFAVAALSSGASTASAAVRSYEGTVVSVDRDNRTFRLRDSERGTITIKVTSSTRFERVSFSSLRSGQSNIEATVRRSNGRWIASKVERSGGGGNHNGTDDHGNDDGPNHG